jgi:hypothetical protein
LDIEPEREPYQVREGGSRITFGQASVISMAVSDIELSI